MQPCRVYGHLPAHRHYRALRDDSSWRRPTEEGELERDMPKGPHGQMLRNALFQDLEVCAIPGRWEGRVGPAFRSLSPL